MSNRKRAILIACSVVLLCVALISGMTYSLFTESFTVKNHLKAGDLNIMLTRTNLEYRVLNDSGYLEVTKNDTVVELSDTRVNLDGSVKTPNVFGISSANMRIAPGTYFKADLKISNPGEVAFTYDVDIVLSEGATDLAKQLRVTIYDGNSNQIARKWLNEYTAEDGFLIVKGSEMSTKSPAESFSVLIEFVDDDAVGSPSNMEDNDYAQGGVAKFDLVVSAVQKTTPGSSTNP